MSNLVNDVRNFANEYREIVQDEIKQAEIIKGLAKAAREKGIDWPQLKRLVKAQELDAIDNKDRVKGIVEKAEFAASYADIISGKMNNFSEAKKTCSSNRAGNDDEWTPGIKPGRGYPNPPTVSIAAASPHVAERPERSEQAPSSELLKAALTACTVETVDADDPHAGLDIPDFLDVRDRLVRS